MRPSLRVLLALLSTTAFAEEPGSSPPDVTDLYEGDIRPYAQYCAEIIGEPLPSFDCTADGVEIPVTVHGHATTRFESERCDRPSFNGQPCRRGARLGSLPFDNPDISAVFICRKLTEDDVERDRYNSVNVIQHNRRNGATCWYRSGRTIDLSPEELPDGREIDPELGVALESAIRSPVESATVNAPSAGAVLNRWRSAKGNVCHTCHQTDPYLQTPFVAQVERNGQKVIPSVYDGPDKLNPRMWSPLNERLDSLLGERVWFAEDSLGASCTTCHALGTNPLHSDGLPSFHPAAVAKRKSDYYPKPSGLRDFEQQHRHATEPDAAWMHADGRDPFSLSPPSPMTLAAFREYADCVARPRPGLCYRTPIPGRPPTTLRIVEPYPALAPTLVPGARIVLQGEYEMHDPGDRIRWRVNVGRQPWKRLVQRTRTGEPLTWVPTCSPGDRVEIIAELVDKHDRVKSDARSRTYFDEIRTTCEGSELTYWSPREKRLESIVDPVRSGSMRERGGGSGGVENAIVPDLLLGDGHDDTSQHSYLTFDIEPPEPGLSVKRAYLRLQIVEDRGVVAANLGDLQFWHYRFNTLDARDYFAPSQFLEGLATTTHTPGRTLPGGRRAVGGVQKIDVTRHVEVARDRGLDVLQLGAWFALDTDGNGARDTVRILNEPRGDGHGNVDFQTTLQPVLVVEFE